MTAVSGSVFTANQYNTYVRNNLLETGVAKVEASGQIIATSGANAVSARTLNSASVGGSAENINSATYTDLSTAGPSVTVDTGSKAMCLITVSLSNTVADSSSFASVEVSGATSISPSEDRAIAMDGVSSSNANRWSGVNLFTTLTAGTNTFTLKYRNSGGNGSFNYRELIVIPF